MDLARLACVKHAASVRPEPGSNSPSEIVEILRRARRRRTRQRLRSRLGSMPWRTSMLTIPASELEEMGGTRREPGTTVLAHPLARMFQVPSFGAATTGTNPLRSPLLTGHEALAFHTLLSFQGASWDRPATLLMVPRVRSRRRSGGHLIVGLPSSSTEHPIPCFRRGCPLFRPIRPDSEERRSATTCGPYKSTTRDVP
jgi:hypothetical protein